MVDEGDAAQRDGREGRGARALPSAPTDNAMTRTGTYLRLDKRKQWEQEQGNKPSDAKPQPVTVIIRRKRAKNLRATQVATEPDADPKGARPP
jgi:hypothetical protein